MSRIVLTNQDLSGRTLDASLQADGHARQSYVGKCDLRGATIIGDIRGSDVLHSDLRGADLSAANLYGCVWRGSAFDDDSRLPDDPGPYGEELVYELVRRYSPQFPPAWRRRAKDILAAHASGDYETFCALCKDVWQNEPDVLRKLWAAMPRRIRGWMKQTFTGFVCRDPNPLSVVRWPDGVSVAVDVDNLPSLEHPDYRYELDQWIIAQAGPINTDVATFLGRYCWTARIRPQLRIHVLPQPDDWLLYGDY